MNLISHATQERLRGLLEKLTTIAQHRMTTYKVKEIIKEVQMLSSRVKGHYLGMDTYSKYILKEWLRFHTSRDIP